MNQLQTKQTVTLSAEYPAWFAQQCSRTVNYADTLNYGEFRVSRRNADNTYTLRGRGLILDSVPRHLIIVERES